VTASAAAQRFLIPGIALRPLEPVQQPGFEWIECEACNTWRLITVAYLAALGDATQGWTCSTNLERPGASCADEPEWRE
jgi:hypothetical protein